MRADPAPRRLTPRILANVAPATALAFAVLDAASGAARPRPLDAARQRPIEGVRLVETSPAITDDAYATGRARLAMGDVPGALAAFREALLASPQSVDALNGMAVCYDRMGRHDLARAFYDSALAIDPHAGQVLNNLGYSLYLQGQHRAAIPILQRAGDSDAESAASARRLLTLVADRLRSDAIATARADLGAERPAELHVDPANRPAVAMVTPPPMRIEVSSNGEQRLVIGGPAADPTASLGDAAQDTLVARPWDIRDERRLAARALADEAAAERAATADLADLIAAEDSRLAAAAAALPPAALPPAALPPVVIASLDSPPAPPPTPPTARASRSAERSRLTAATAMTSGIAVIAAPPTAIAPLRRGDRAAFARADAGEGPRRDGTRSGFHSDDDQLNSFAARIRSKPVLAARTAPRPGAAAAPVTIAEALRRLESLVARARAA